MFAFRSSWPDSGRGPVDLAFTDRYGGASRAPFDELNLALAGEDDRDAVEENLARTLTAFAPGARLADMRQVHGSEVVRVAGEETAGGRPACDALVTREREVVLMVRVADCVPVLLADAAHGVVGAAHAGRAGVEQGVAPAAVDEMRRLGAVTITAWIGPHVCGGCYEVPPQLQDRVAAVVPTARATTTWGTASLDLGAAVRTQLEDAGATVVDASRCTRESADLYSHRRDGTRAGRFAGLVRLRGTGS